MEQIVCLSTLEMFTLIRRRESKHIELAFQECKQKKKKKKKRIQVTADPG